MTAQRQKPARPDEIVSKQPEVQTYRKMTHKNIIKDQNWQQTFEESTPHAKYIAAVFLVAFDSCCVSYGSVICARREK